MSQEFLESIESKQAKSEPIISLHRFSSIFLKSFGFFISRKTHWSASFVDKDEISVRPTEPRLDDAALLHHQRRVRGRGGGTFQNLQRLGVETCCQNIFRCQFQGCDKSVSSTHLLSSEAGNLSRL